MENILLTGSPFHVSMEGMKLGELELKRVNSVSWGGVSPPELWAAVCPDGLYIYHERHCFDSYMWAFSEREVTQTLSSHTFVFSLWVLFPNLILS